MIIGYVNPGVSTHEEQKDLGDRFGNFGMICDSQCFIGGPDLGLEEITLSNGSFDHLHLEAGRSSLGNEFLNDIGRQDRFMLQTILLMLFRGNLEGGSAEADDHTITQFQVMRRISGSMEEWLPINQFAYNPERNWYTADDRYPISELEWEYSFVPIAHEWIGRPIESNPVSVKFGDMFLTDATENIAVRYNINIGSIMNNSIMGTMTPLNGQFPIVSFGNSNYKTGTITFLPITHQTMQRFGASIDAAAEYKERRMIVNWLMNGQARVLRAPGVNYIVVTHDIVETPLNGGNLPLAEITMNYTEIEEFNFNALFLNGLLPEVQEGNFWFAEDGSPIVSGGMEMPW